jgi:hypothetical protein
MPAWAAAVAIFGRKESARKDDRVRPTRVTNPGAGTARTTLAALAILSFNVILVLQTSGVAIPVWRDEKRG